ncbi:glycosyltransferase family 2 protein [Nocardioides mesophilus]|uniref:Glycosyltransferase family 2 protein n=1 Tax=Nocardioides mesophilus TaxID=433659 RepID=A0A7G9RC43_9ACTN|nr:glycosyltransferase [Nocardioides mesophilus]QNN53168.1 glycosyltransferase family 2 protein [Nocardioides mesophilus]
MTPRVSVVVPTYNNADHIAATMRSILQQSFADFELIVSDHASTDGTWELLQQFSHDPRIHLERISSGGGAERNWNHVSSMASAPLLKLVCGDDLLDPECLVLQVQAVDRGGAGVVMVAGRRDIVDARGAVVTRARGLPRMKGRVSGSDAVRRTIRSGTNVFGEPCAVLLRRDALEAVGGWEGTHGYVIDLATYVKVLACGDLIALEDAVASFRLSAGQWSVRLLAEQVGQVDSLRRTVATLYGADFALTRADLLTGAVATRVQARKRRLAYQVLARRL